ncbi:very long chain fatty acid elongase 7-like [Artemia franciscana]|uniref:Elongation of very long chain fatty acids protein n=2 Tax=Artemia franciscana TaxID=6661 RepID=A0A9E8Z2V2_ARTSF|nr:fatty acid elongase [Artemia franciscana]
MDFLNNIIESGDSRVAEWFLVKSPIPVICVMILYIIFVIVAPRVMENRKPFDLKFVLMVYNAFQIYLSAWMAYETFMSAWLSNYDLRCQPVDTSTSPLAMRMARACWWFYFSKYIDLLDTVFFILRKKQSQVTFLHVYHHCTMIFNWWMGMKYAPGGQSFFVAMLNSMVHTVMYSYYLLSGFGPKVQKYLWWKRYLTQFQLIQFVLITVHILYGYFNNCDFPNFLVWFVSLYCFTLIGLFSNFYIRSYLKSSAKKHLNQSSNGFKKVD